MTNKELEGLQTVDKNWPYPILLEASEVIHIRCPRRINWAEVNSLSVQVTLSLRPQRSNLSEILLKAWIIIGTRHLLESSVICCVFT